MRSRSHSQTLRGALIAIVVLILSLLIIISPLGLISFQGLRVDWAALSEIGQAYGGVTAILSTLALCAISASLLLQHRQTSIAQVVAVRNRQLELVKLGIENPDLLSAVVPVGQPESEIRLTAYMNLWVTQWHMGWDLGWESEQALRRYAAQLFASPIARSWWGATGTWYLDHRTKRRHETFYEIMNREWIRACEKAQLQRN